ncbi:M14 family metallopeptidase [Microbulbifer marinus]|uniref:Succinylglutamate desuccinylase / Aspartoacylase family protein n=1 Tax=Microbulbifer marinus TaxID=658218 RepID=A0A1H3VPI1_9GAMM|nr:M14 family metallopeptidase [Microbulbifer marinus]SDZ76028.1 Succinylglutamate desuccinylase / Aspartoacylase family protein [Microbulbifer marinus]
MSGKVKLNFLEALPEAFFSCDHPSKLREIFAGPTLVSLQGAAKEPLMISTLLHGNETTGFFALQQLLKAYRDRLPRSLLIFFGNVEAAALGVRHLPGQPDFNRIWGGGESPEARMAREVLGYARERQVIANVDIHNTTGRNPYYACVNRTSADFLRLANGFTDIVIYFTEPHEVNSNAFAKICPSVTLECGLPGLPEGVEHLYRYLDNLLLTVGNHDATANDCHIYHTVARLKLPYYCTFNFEFDQESGKDFSFARSFDHFNFRRIAKGTVIAYARRGGPQLAVLDNSDRLVTEKYFGFCDGKVITLQEIIPSMFTTNGEVAREDSLGYLMEPYRSG